jgi:methyl-accepting chemotaxis protein
MKLFSGGQGGIGLRLGGAFGALTLLLLAVAGFGITRLSALNGTVDSLLQHESRANDLAAHLMTNAHHAAAALGRAVLADGVADIQAGIKEATALRADSQDVQKALAEVMHDDAGMAALKAVQAAEPPYRAAIDKVVTAIQGGDSDAARTALNDKTLRSTEATYVVALQALATHQAAAMTQAQQQSEASYANARNLMLAAAVMGAALAALLGLWITRSLVAPAAQAVAVARRIAAGDLTQDVQAQQQDEMGQILQAMQAMQQALRSVVGGVRTGSDSIATASQQIAQGNQHLSERTEQQASALQQTAASMEQLSSTVRQNADNARQADQLARSANSVARSGGQVVGEVVQTMKGINESSRRIADIISVIDGIAFQTNILALNAAVEAARAGEQGRGFAVVASEVRNLAQRSAEAAREIKSLITASVERVDQGTALVDRAGTTMTEVVASIERVTAIVGEISAASAEQSSGVSQVGDAVGQMDKATQQNAALVEEGAAAAESLSEQARQLVAAVAVFRLDGSPVLPAAVPAVAPVERRGPDRARNVLRPDFKPRAAAPAPAAANLPAPAPAATPAARTGTDDWESF